MTATDIFIFFLIGANIGVNFICYIRLRDLARTLPKRRRSRQAKPEAPAP